MSVSPNDLIDIEQRLANIEREQELRMTIESETIKDLIKNEISKLRNKEHLVLGSGKKKLKPINTKGKSVMIDGEISTPISLSYLNQKITDLEHTTHQLNDQVTQILKRLETTADKFKSISDFKKEFKAFFSRDGHSAVLETNSIFKKVLWLSCMIALFVTGMFLTDKNVKGYQAHDVVTQIQVIDVEKIKFPAITFCLVEYYDGEFETQDFKSVISKNGFSFDYIPYNIDDLEKVSIFSNAHYNYRYVDCYKFNGERNVNNQKAEILSSKKVGSQSGLYLELNMSQKNTLLYHIGDNNVKPLFIELESLKSDASFHLISMKKTVDLKLPKPFSNCTENIDKDTSYLVREIIQQNITYRQKYCYEECYKQYLKNYTSSRNISTREAFHYLTFDYTGNCSGICPLECSSISFETFKSERNIYSDSFIVSFYFTDRRYTVISQSEKTTITDLISNIGGVLGLFLELSFISAIRFIIFIFDIFLFETIFHY